MSLAFEAVVNKWMRRCEECGNKQQDMEPVYGKEPSAAYLNRKCKKCKSESLDYGSTCFYDKNDNQVWCCDVCNSWFREWDKHDCVEDLEKEESDGRTTH